MTEEQRFQELLNRIAVLEGRVAALEGGKPAERPRFSSDAIDPLEPSASVRELWAKGHKIRAIKAYQDETGVGLKEAKARVEALPG